MKHKLSDRSDWQRVTKRRFSVEYLNRVEFTGYVGILWMDEITEPLVVAFKEQQPSRNTILPIHTYHSSTVRVIDGLLPGGRQLAHPLTLLIEYDDEEVVVSEPHFHMHSSAPTEAEAIAAFRCTFSGYLDVLTSQEEKLGTHLRDQLQYLRSAIRSA